MIYKLTTQALTTYEDFQWELGVEVRTPGEGELVAQESRD